MRASIVRAVVLCAACAASFLPACGGEAPSAPSTDVSAGGGLATKSPDSSALPPARTLVLQPRTPEQIARQASRKTRAKTVRRPGGSLTGGGAVGAGSNFTDPKTAVAASFVNVGSDRVGLYDVAGDATSADYASFMGGPTIPNLHLQIIFWGSQWSTATTSENSSSQADIETAIQRVLQTSYLDDMKQYGWQTADIRGFWDVPTDPPTSFAFSDVGDMVQSLIDQGSFPDTDAPGGDSLYMVFMPQNASPSDADAAGAHGTQSDDDAGDIDYLLFGYVSYGSPGATLGIFTHEMVESISDPSVSVDYAWIMDHGFMGQPSENEIADACNHTFDSLDGMIVEAYFSQAQRACVIPFQGPPTITSVSPDEGPERGGQAVKITGTGFDTFGSTQFSFGGSAASNVHCTSTTSCTVTTPSGYGTAGVSAFENYFSSSGATYLYGPGTPDCSASYACQHDGSGATTISCLFGLTGLTLQRLSETEGWQNDTAASTTAVADAFVDYDYPAAGTEISYQVTATSSFGTAVTPPMTVTSLDCACSPRAVCKTATGKEIYPQVGAPSDWCTLQGGHMTTLEVCP